MNLIQIIGATGVLVSLVFYAMLVAERQGWVNPMPSAVYRRDMLRDTHAILVISLILIIGPLVRLP